jgi:hypothetical protein
MSTKRARRPDPSAPDDPVTTPKPVALAVRQCPQCGRPIGPMLADVVVCPRRHQTAVSNG